MTTIRIRILPLGVALSKPAPIRIKTRESETVKMTAVILQSRERTEQSSH